MKARLLLGIAALAAPAMLVAPASAQVTCTTADMRARVSTDIVEVRRILNQSGDCPTAIVGRIRDRMRFLEANPPAPTVDVVSPTSARADNTTRFFSSPATETPAPPAAPPADTRPRETSAPAPQETEATPEVISEPAPPPPPLQALTVGQPLSGAQLVEGDEVFGSLYYDQYSLQLEAGQFVEIVLQAQGFAPIVAIGQGRAPDNFYDLADAFPESDTAQEVRLRYLATDAGEYTILAASVEQYGGYSISIMPFVPPPPPRPTPIALDSAITGTFDADSPILYEENSVPYALYSFRARAGEPLQFSMTSADGSGIDPYLVIGRMNAGAFEELDRNDDRGDGTLNSMLRFTPDQDGEYVVRARTFSAGQLGEFNLSAYRVATLTAPQELSRRAGAWVRQGEISVETPILAGTEESTLPLRYVSYEFTARAGQSYRVHAYSSAFQPIVDIVRQNGEAVDVYQKAASTRSPDDVSFEASRGTYIVRVAAQPDQNGAFDIVISEVE